MAIFVVLNVYFFIRPTQLYISCILVHLILLRVSAGTALAQWLSYCATNRKVADSIPDGVIGIFH